MTIEPNGYKALQDENKQLQQQIEVLNSENYELQNELITQQMNVYDKNEYIKKLKNELFNAYLDQQ